MIQITICSPIIEDPIDLKTAQFELTDDKRNAEIAAYHKQYGQHLTIYGHEAYLVYQGTHRTLALLQEQRVVYLCYYEEHQNRKYSHLVQLLVWQDETQKGLARRMLDWFLGQYDYLLLSDTQYPKGVAMYQKYIRDNLGEKHVYLKNNAVVTAIKSVEQFDSLIDKIWSRNTSHKNVRLIISNTEINL